MLRMTTGLLAAGILAALAQAQTGPVEEDCTHQVTEPVEARVDSHYPQPCGTNASLNLGSFRYESKAGVCPLVVLITPAHARAVSKPGSRSNVRFEATFPVVCLHFECVSTHFLFFEVSSTCTFTGATNVGGVHSYVQYACERV